MDYLINYGCFAIDRMHLVGIAVKCQQPKTCRPYLALEGKICKKIEQAAVEPVAFAT